MVIYIQFNNVVRGLLVITNSLLRKKVIHMNNDLTLLFEAGLFILELLTFTTLLIEKTVAPIPQLVSLSLNKI